VLAIVDAAATAEPDVLTVPEVVPPVESICEINPYVIAFVTRTSLVEVEEYVID
jgi:hypothetical protein